MITVSLLSPDDQRCQAFKEAMLRYQALAAPAVILFMGDRWRSVKVVAMLSVNGIDAGMATLAPRAEHQLPTDPHPQPTLMSLWIDPEFKSHPQYRHAGYELLKRLVDESVKRYHRAPVFSVVTRTEQELAIYAREQGVEFTLSDLTGDAAPDW